MKATRPFLLSKFYVALCISPLLSLPSASAQDATEHVYAIGKDVKEPRLQNVEVVSSDTGTCQDGLSGKVTFSIIVDTSGHPRNIFFVKPLGNSLDKLALVVVEADQFTPATRDSAPVSASLSVEVKLKGCMVQMSDGTQQLRLYGTPTQKFKKDEDRQGEIQFTPEPGAPLKPGESLAKPSRIGGSVSSPIILVAPEAEYTDLARREGINGVCLISVIIDAQGLPRAPRVVKPAGYGLDQNALAVVSRYRFKPALKNGEPVPVILTIEVNFKLYRKYN